MGIFDQIIIQGINKVLTNKEVDKTKLLGEPENEYYIFFKEWYQKENTVVEKRSKNEVVFRYSNDFGILRHKFYLYKTIVNTGFIMEYELRLNDGKKIKLQEIWHKYQSQSYDECTKEEFMYSRMNETHENWNEKLQKKLRLYDADLIRSFELKKISQSSI